MDLRHSTDHPPPLGGSFGNLALRRTVRPDIRINSIHSNVYPHDRKRTDCHVDSSEIEAAYTSDLADSFQLFVVAVLALALVRTH
jgi:hypothetical protein